MSKVEYKQVKVNFRPDDYDRLKQIADDRGETLAGLLRQAVGAEIERATARRRVRCPDVDEAARQIAAVGRNLNQITRAVTAKQQKGALSLFDEVAVQQLIAIREELGRIADAIKRPEEPDE